MNCPSCGRPRVPGAQFCTTCGTHFAAAPEPPVTPIPDQADRAACPYCHSSLVSGADGRACPECGAVHHAECWRANGGCAITGCACGPVPGAVAVAAPAPSPAPLAPAASGGRKRLTVALLVGSLIVILGGLTFIGMSLISGDDTPPVVPSSLLTPTTSTTSSSTTASGDAGGGDNRKSKSPPGNPSTASDATVRRALRSLMRRHYTDVDNGDWSEAYRTLSSHKREQKRTEAARNGLASGVAMYRSQFQGELQGQLRMGGLRVRLNYVDPDRREAELVLSIPKENGGCYSGATWAEYERRRGWLFDIGSSGHADRPTSGTAVLQSRSAPC